MPDDNQTTTPDPTTGLNQSEEQAANAALENASGVVDAGIPNLDKLEYATPSAYIDPDLPANPTPVTDPNEETSETEPQEASPEEETLEMTPEQIAEMLKASHEIMSKVAERIANSRNILIATSSDPSVDELAAAIGLSLFLDRIGKHAIAIYSGKTPNALEFLKPEDTFETNADVLQDFVIALNKEKADHLRYKLDGDYVKIFITPYKDKIVSDDLEFSYGDYNVDLVLALNVDNGVDLDAALREHGRIMHDATVINITTGNPGKFGEIEWNNKRASSISEMIADLLCNASGDAKINAEEATALLTGIVASTDRFARANTVSTTMQIASQLIENGADPQLVAENVTDEVDNQFFEFSDLKSPKSTSVDEAESSSSTPASSDEDYSFSFAPTKEPEETISPDDDTALKITHADEPTDQTEEAETNSEVDSRADSETTAPAETPEENTSDNHSETQTEPLGTESSPEEPTENNALMDELKATEASLSGIGDSIAPEAAAPAPVASTNSNTEFASAPSSLDSSTPLEATMSPAGGSIVSPETTIAAPTSFEGGTNKYSQMLEDALNEPSAGESAPMESALPPATPEINPAASVAPAVTESPEISTMPEINYNGTADGQVLPPPPAPPVDLSLPLPTPTDPSSAPTPEQPTNQAQSSAVETPDTTQTPTPPTTPPSPDTFTIPGM